MMLKPLLKLMLLPPNYESRIIALSSSLCDLCVSQMQRTQPGLASQPALDDHSQPPSPAADAPDHDHDHDQTNDA